MYASTVTKNFSESNKMLLLMPMGGNRVQGPHAGHTQAFGRPPGTSPAPTGRFERVSVHLKIHSTSYPQKAFIHVCMNYMKVEPYVLVYVPNNVTPQQ